MNKSTRLDKELNEIEQRFELIKAYLEIDRLSGRIPAEDIEDEQKYLSESMEFIRKVNSSTVIDDETVDRVTEIAACRYTRADGRVIPLLTEYEADCLRIRHGTLTPEERSIMETHVIMTGAILEKVHFQKDYEKRPWESGI